MGTERLLTERSRYTGDYDDTPVAQVANLHIGPCLVSPQAVAVGGPYYTATVDMRGYEKALICILGGASGDMGDSLYVEVLQCATASGLEAMVVGAKAITGIGHAVGKIISDSALGSYSYSGYYYYNMNRKWLIEVDVEEMDVDAGFRYLQVSYTVTGHPWLLAMEAERSLASYEPCPQTFVDQVVT